MIGTITGKGQVARSQGASIDPNWKPMDNGASDEKMQREKRKKEKMGRDSFTYPYLLGIAVPDMPNKWGHNGDKM